VCVCPRGRGFDLARTLERAGCESQMGPHEHLFESERVADVFQNLPSTSPSTRCCRVSTPACAFYACMRSGRLAKLMCICYVIRHTLVCVCHATRHTLTLVRHTALQRLRTWPVGAGGPGHKGLLFRLLSWRARCAGESGLRPGHASACR
jgi:hypothetical protein